MSFSTCREFFDRRIKLFFASHSTGLQLHFQSVDRIFPTFLKKTSSEATIPLYTAFKSVKTTNISMIKFIKIHFEEIDCARFRLDFEILFETVEARLREAFGCRSS